MPAPLVAITGLGVVSPLGNSPAELWDALAAGRSGVAPLQSLPPLAERVVYGGEADGFTGHIDDFGELPKDRKKAIRKALKMMCRETMMAVAAAQRAAGDAGFAEQPMEPEQSGVVFGSDYMLSPPEDFITGMTACGAAEGNLRCDEWGQTGLAEMNPLWMLKYLPNMPASHIGIFNDLRGPNNSLTLRETAGTMAIREAAQTIERGHAQRMLAGATGTRIHSFKTVHAAQTEQLADPGLPPQRASAPFDRGRTGMVCGEGAGALLLESVDAARARGAHIYGVVRGAGSAAAADAQLRANRQLALTRAMRAALSDAKMSPSDIGHVAAHGLGTIDSDAAEAAALAEVFGSDGAPPTVAAKSYFGNLGAGSGVVELIGSLLALQRGSLFATLNFSEGDPEQPAPIASNGAPAGESCMHLSVTPQGQAAAIIVGRSAG